MIPRLLLVEDDVRFATLVREYLAAAGFDVAWEERGDRAVERVLAERPDLVLLDIMLPGEDGLSVCRRLRPRFAGPILMLTARGEEIDEVLGLELGADDYVGKPVSPRLLLARVKALLRRGDGASGDRVVVGPLVVDATTREARLGGAALDLTTADFDLLLLLARSAGAPVSREDLVRALRGIAYDGVDRSVDVRISQLRRKLADADGATDWIKTVRGVGYQLARRDG